MYWLSSGCLTEGRVWYKWKYYCKELSGVAFVLLRCFEGAWSLSG